MINSIENLPAEMQFYINCNRGYDIREELFNEFKNNNTKDSEVVISLLEDLYIEKISVDEFIGGLKKISLPDEQINSFIIELLGRDLLVMDDYFSGKIYQTIKKLGGEPEKYQDYVKDFENDWRQESNKYIEEGDLLPEDDGIIDPELEKKEIYNQLNDNLRDVLVTDSIEANASLQEANMLIGYTLSLNESYKNDFIKALTDNQTDLTDVISLDNEKGGEVVTVSSWLADYLSFSGNRFNDNLMAARYIIESPRVKKLSDDDKLRVKNLIALYRNIYNFPNNFDYNQPENTQFFPIDVLKIRYGKLEELIKPEKKLPEKQDLKDSKSEKPVLEENKTSNDVKQETPLTKASKRYQFVFSSLNLGSDLSSAQQTLANKTLDEIITSWRQSFSGNDKILLIASLAELFKRPNYSITWFNTPEIREVLSSQVVAYPSLAEPVNREGVVANIVIAVVTKAILQRLGFSDEQAAIIYLQIAGHEPKLASFVFFDAKLNKFSWRKFIDE